MKQQHICTKQRCGFGLNELLGGAATGNRHQNETTKH